MRHRITGNGSPPPRPTLLDRLAVAFAAGVLTFVITALMWFGVSRLFMFDDGLPPFTLVWAATGVMACLGFALQINPVADALAWLLRAFRLDWWNGW